MKLFFRVIKVEQGKLLPFCTEEVLWHEALPSIDSDSKQIIFCHVSMLILLLCSKELILIALLLTWIKTAFDGPNLPCIDSVCYILWTQIKKVFLEKKMSFCLCFFLWEQNDG